MRRFLIVAAVVAALGGSTVAGAIVEGNVTTISSGEFAQLGSSSIYCQAFTENQANAGRPGFDCGDWAGNHHIGSSYSAIVDQLGVEVDRWDASGLHSHPVLTYLNP